MDTIGQRIKKLRNEQSLTLKQVAGEELSAAMVSLIENDKTTPSVNTLTYIANKLGVDISYFIDKYTKEDLKKIIRDLTQLLEDSNEKNLIKAVNRLKGMVDNLGNNFEAARIHEIYAQCLYFLYRDYGYNKNDWETYAKKAKNIYMQLQMTHRSLKVDFFLAKIQEENQNYNRTLELVDKVLNNYQLEMEEYEVCGVILDFMLLKINTLSGMGYITEALKLLEEAIQYSKNNMVFSHLYQLHNNSAFLLYNEGRISEAQDHLAYTQKLYDLTENDTLYAEMICMGIHYKEFFENEIDLAFNLIEEFERKLPYLNLLNEDIRTSYYNYLSEFKARCYTKINCPEKALLYFKDFNNKKYYSQHPLDISIREITFSYRALCYKELKDWGKAKKNAEKSVEKLRFFPHTKYYEFAKDVVRMVGNK